MNLERNIMGSGKSGIRILPLSEVVMSADELRDEEERTREAQRIADEKAKKRADAKRDIPSDGKPNSAVSQIGDLVIPMNISDSENYIFLEGRNHGSYSYDDCFVAMHRLGLNSQVEKLGQELKLDLKNTAKEQDGTPYIGNINWFNALSLAYHLGGEVMTPRQGIDFKELIEKGINEKNAIIYNGKKEPIKDIRVLERVYDEMFGARAPWRSEWLDADFKLKKVKKKDVLHLLYSHEVKNGILVPRGSEILEDCIMNQDCYADTTSFNRQGFPTRNKSDSGFFFYYPRSDNNSVARFYADSDRAVLVCDGNPTYADSSLGVRFVAKNFGGKK